MTLADLYLQLLRAYGPQGWWPLHLSGAGYHPQHFELPQTDLERLEIALGAVLTQNTAWNNVEKALTGLKEAGFFGLEQIAIADPQSLGLAIKPAGYFNQKARYLINLAQFFITQPFTQLRTLPMVEARGLLLKVTGIGEETADSILLYALGQPSFVIDTYTRRILGNLGLCDPKVPYHKLQALFHKQLEPDVNLFQEYHALLVAHAKTFYRKKPYPSLDPVLTASYT